MSKDNSDYKKSLVSVPAKGRDNKLHELNSNGKPASAPGKPNTGQKKK